MGLREPVPRPGISAELPFVVIAGNGPTTWFTSFSGDLYLRYQCTFEEHDCPDQHGSNT